MAENAGEARDSLKEWTKKIMHRFDQCDQTIDNLLGGDAQLSLSRHPLEQPNTYDLNAPPLQRTTDIMHRFDQLNQSLDNLLRGDAPPQDVTPHSDTPNLQSPVEWERYMNIRFDQLNQNLDNLFGGDALP